MASQTVDPPDDKNAPRSRLGDGILLDQFVQEGSEDAFAALMNRHGPYVRSVCQHVTLHVQDAEDVFQACFLELVRKAASIRQRQSLAGWLQTVAVRLARKARARRARRQLKETAGAKAEASVGPEDMSWREACRILEEEIARLPEDLRAPILLCLFRGQTQDEAAQDLGINPRTLKDRLRRGREQLRDRLVRRGVTLGILGTLLAVGDIQAALPAALHQATLAGATALVNKAPLAGVVSPGVLGMTGVSVFAGWGTVAAVMCGVLLTAAAGIVAWDQLTKPAPSVAAAGGPRTLYRSFRGKQFDAELLRWSGPTPQKYIRREEDGLRITLPAENGPADGVGVRLRYPLRGDFELEATFDLLDVDRPDAAPERAGGGAGATIYLLMDSADLDGVWLGKTIKGSHGPAFSVGHRVKRGEERFNKFLKTVPAEQERGLVRLRVVRKGAMFSFYGAEGAAETLQPILDLEVSAADVSIVRFAADPAWAPDVAIDVRLVEITMTAEEFVGYEPPTP